MSLLNKEEQKKVDSLFKKREYRLLAIELLNGWTREPNLNEGRDISEQYKITTRQMRRVIGILKENQLFTAEEGSMALFRKKLKDDSTVPQVAQVSQTPQTSDNNEISSIEQGVPVKPREELNYERLVREYEEKEDAGQYDERFEDLELKVKGFSTRIDGVDRHLMDIKDFMGQITGQLGQAQQPTQQEQNPQLQQTLPIDENPSLPDGLTIEETVNPSIASLPNPQEFPGFVHANPNELVEMEGQIIAIKSVGFVPKSLMLFDIVKNRGFKGNLADFVNSCIADSFKGRKVKLVISDEEEIL